MIHIDLHLFNVLLYICLSPVKSLVIFNCLLTCFNIDVEPLSNIWHTKQTVDDRLIPFYFKSNAINSTTYLSSKWTQVQVALQEIN